MVGKGLGSGLGIKMCENGLGFRRKELPVERTHSIENTFYREHTLPVEMKAGHVVGPQEEIFSKFREL